MSDLYWLTDEQSERLRPYFPKSQGKPRVDDRRVLSGIVIVNRNGLRWRNALSAYLGVGAGLPNHLHSADPRARVSTYGTATALGSIYDPVAFTTPQAVGYTRTWDGLGNITFDLSELAPGVAASFVFDAGLYEDVATIGAAD